MLTTDERQQIAQTILQQLGGSRFRLMTGAKNFIFGETGDLSFQLPRSVSKWNGVRIELTPMDVYRVTFSKWTKLTVTETDVHESVYAEDLRGLFERVTGLATSLGTMGRKS